MTDKQLQALKLIDAEWRTLKEIGEIAASTATSLVSLGLVEREKRGKVYVYRKKSISEEENTKIKYKNMLADAKGAYSHLDNAYSYWSQTCEKMGIQFDKEKFYSWASPLQEKIEDRIINIPEEYKDETGKDLFYERGAF